MIDPKDYARLMRVADGLRAMWRAEKHRADIMNDRRKAAEKRALAAEAKLREMEGGNAEAV